MLIYLSYRIITHFQHGTLNVPFENNYDTQDQK